MVKIGHPCINYTQNTECGEQDVSQTNVQYCDILHSALTRNRVKACSTQEV